jgi:hypothetical protein
MVMHLLEPPRAVAAASMETIVAIIVSKTLDPSAGPAVIGLPSS